MIRPLHDLVLIRPLHDLVLMSILDGERIGISDGGLVLPDTAVRAARRARVVAVGPGRVAWRVRVGGLWCRRPPRPEETIRDWRARDPLPVGVDVGDVVLVEDHSCRWTSSGAEFPGPGDQALYPAHAILAVLSGDERVEVERVGVEYAAEV